MPPKSKRVAKAAADKKTTRKPRKIKEIHAPFELPDVGSIYRDSNNREYKVKSSKYHGSGDTNRNPAKTIIELEDLGEEDPTDSIWPYLQKGKYKAIRQLSITRLNESYVPKDSKEEPKQPDTGVTLMTYIRKD